jgi:enoyl-CoA hydratase
MSYKTIKIDYADSIATLTFNRPDALNAINQDMLDETRSAIDEINKNIDIKVLVLTGAGRAFIAGADIKTLQGFGPLEAKKFSECGQSLFAEIESMNIPVIACVNGFALGGGCEIAMSCDFIYASDKARFGQPEINLGIIPGFGGTQRLSRLAGKGRAKELCMTGKNITAEEACKIGLVTRVFPQESLLEETMKTAKEIAGKGRASLRALKHVIDNGSDVDLKNACIMEVDAFSICFASPDMKEGTTAFIEKRSPNFTGKL